MIQAIIDFFSQLIGNDIVTIILVSMIPIVELRGAIPIAIQMGMNPFLAFLYSYLGCAIVIPLLLLLLKPLIEWMKKIKFFKNFAMAVEGVFENKVKKVEMNAEKSNSSKVGLKKMLAVGLFVAVPVPMTGVWTGCAIAVFMGIPFWKSFGAVMVGNAIAGAIITLLAFFFRPYLDTILMVFLILVVILLALFIVKLILKFIKVRKANKLLDEQSNNDCTNNDSDNDNCDASVNVDSSDALANCDIQSSTANSDSANNDMPKDAEDLEGQGDIVENQLNDKISCAKNKKTSKPTIGRVKNNQNEE